jgi:hypothetical protein
MILDEIESFTFDKNRKHMFGIKSAIVWGNKPGASFPLLYITKPKGIDLKDYEEILNKLSISLWGDRKNCVNGHFIVK